MSIWHDNIKEYRNPEFWICYHACMLFLHGIFTYDQFNEIYKKQNKS